eukprot:XP_011412787.1 PREDICTED: uncharacterized protein LOC105317756 isoform X2 [Crassostrea gigas]
MDKKCPESMRMYCQNNMCFVFQLSSLLLLMLLKEGLACGVPPAVPSLDMNISVVGEFTPGTVLHFKCNSTSKLDRHHDTERVTMLCLENNTWTIRGAENCKPEKCYIAAAILLTSLVLAVSGAVSYILTMIVIRGECTAPLKDMLPIFPSISHC